MGKHYDPNNLTKKQRHMKKWIPDWVYCEGGSNSKRNKRCPFWKEIWFPVRDDMIRHVNENYEGEKKKRILELYQKMIDHPYKHKREECQFRSHCDKDCEKCTEIVSHCKFLNYTEYGQFPLADMCKICDIHMSGYKGPMKTYKKRKKNKIKE